MGWSLRCMNQLLSNSNLSLNQLTKGSNLVFSPPSLNAGLRQIVAGTGRPSLMQSLSFISSSSTEFDKLSSDLVAGGPKQDGKKRSTKIGIAIRSFDHPDKSLWGLPPNARKIGLPETRVLYTVLRSPHIDKKSREQFHMEIKKQFVVIKTHRDELRKKFFWLKRQRIFGAQYEIQLTCKTRLDKAKLQSLLP